MSRDKRSYAGQAWGRSISADGAICDTLWKRHRKARQQLYGRGPGAESKTPTPAAIRSRAPEFIQIINRAYQMWGLTR
jgi:hypothetical protein